MQCTFSYPFQQNTLGCYQDATASEFIVDTNSLVNYDPHVAALGNGSFVVVWWDGSGGNIHGQKVKNCFVYGLLIHYPHEGQIGRIGLLFSAFIFIIFLLLLQIYVAFFECIFYSIF